MNFKYSCVPRGKTRAMYSAPTIATANASGLRLSVETMTVPPGFANAASAATLAAGSGTCSSISMQVTRSKAAGRSCASSSAARARYSTATLPSSACSSATSSTLCDKSMPSTCAPARAIASDRMPPPQPTSSTCLPGRLTARSMYRRRKGLRS